MDKDKLVEPCRCLGSVTDIPCICNPRNTDPGWLARVLEQNEAQYERLPAALRSHAQPK